jgi:hypothetical protein
MTRTTSGGGTTPPPTAAVPSSLVPILYLQMVTILMFVAHEVFWDTTSAIVPTTRLSAFLPHVRELQEPPLFVLGMHPPTPSPRMADAANWLPTSHSKFHHSNITQKVYEEVSCPTNSSSSSNGNEEQSPPPQQQQIPTFVLGGTQKAGTSALFYLLKGASPTIVSSTRFETHFFDNAIRKTITPHLTGDNASNETLCQLARDYRAEFPDVIPDNAVTFEKVRRRRNERRVRRVRQCDLTRDLSTNVCVQLTAVCCCLFAGPVVLVPVTYSVVSETGRAVDENRLYLAQSD